MNAEGVIRGRDSLLATIRNMCERAAVGHSSVLLVDGPAGFGKTRVLQAAAELAGECGLQVGHGRAVAGDHGVPMSPIFGALFDGTPPLVNPGERSRLHYLPEQRYWLLDELESLFERAALERPVLVAIDDAQWADNGTLLALRTLPSRLASLPIIWAVAMRTNAASAELRAVADRLTEDGAVRARLVPLDDPSVAQIVADLTGAVPDQPLMRLTRLTHGSPFLLMELVRGLKEEALVRIEDGKAVLVQNHLPARLGESMRDRLARMPELTRRIARTASALGRSFTFDQVATMTGETAAALIAPVEELLAADLLIESDTTLAFSHDLIRDAVRDSLPVTALRALQRQAVDVLLTAGAPPVEIAAQLAISAAPGDDGAVDTLRQAASALAASDPDSAADLSRKALDLASPHYPSRAALVAQTALYLHAAGRVPEGKAFADEVLRQALTSEQEAEVLLSIVNLYGLSADVRAEAGLQALALPDVSPLLRTRHLAYLAHNRTVAGRPEEAHAVLPELREAVRQTGDVPARYALELAESGLHYFKGDFALACERVDVCVRTGALLAEPSRTVLVHYWRAEVYSVLDRYQEAIQFTAENLARAQNARQVWGSFLFEGGRGRQLLHTGRLEDAGAALEPAVEAAEHVSQASVLDATAAVALGRVAIHTGNSDQLKRCLEFTESLRKSGTPAVKRHAAWLSALAAMSGGDVAKAREEALELAGSHRDWMESRLPLDITDEVALMRIALATGDAELADLALTAAQDRLDRNPAVATIAGVAAHCRGLRHDDPDALEQAIASFARSPRPLALASAVEDAGMLAEKTGNRERAVLLLGQALETYAEHGATWDAARARGRLRRLGVRRRLVTATRPQHGWAGLTKSELDVVRLVARGLTNREAAERLYLSVHTVSSHLRSAFTKLDINSRVELARIAAAEKGPRPWQHKAPEVTDQP